MRNATKRATFVYPHVYLSEITNNHHNQPTLESIALHASLTDNPYTIEDLAPSRPISPVFLSFKLPIRVSLRSNTWPFSMCHIMENKCIDQLLLIGLPSLMYTRGIESTRLMLEISRIFTVHRLMPLKYSYNIRPVIHHARLVKSIACTPKRQLGWRISKVDKRFARH